MKKFTLIFITLCAGYYSAAFAQNDTTEVKNETLFGKMKLGKVSGMGGTFVEFSNANSEFAVFNGGGGAVIFNQTFYIGAYGMGLSTLHKMVYSDSSVIKKIGDRNHVSFGHGGLWIGYLNKSHKLLHWGVSSKFGVGAVSLYDIDFEDNDYASFANDVVMVFTPQLEAELNVTSWFKVNVGAGYRVVSGIDKTQYYKKDMLNSPEGTIKLLFGGFAKR